MDIVGTLVKVQNGLEIDHPRKDLFILSLRVSTDKMVYQSMKIGRFLCIRMLFDDQKDG